MHSKHASRRRHSAELKDKVLAACAEPGASVAAVALAHDLNANLVHKWRRCHKATPPSSTPQGTAPHAVTLSLPPAALAAAPSASASMAGRLTAATAPQPGAASPTTDAAPAFVPVRVEMPRAAPADIRLELHRGAATVIVTWPAQEAAACGSWLREWLG
jgi:transposase